MALSFRQKALLSTPLPATWMSTVIIHNVYVKFYTDVIGLDPKYVGWVYLVFNIWHFINDPLIGVLLDKMKYRPGKGKFLFVMRRTIPFMLTGLVLMAWSSPGWSQGVIFTVFLIELFLFDVAASFYLIAATGYVYLAAPTREERIDVEVGKVWVGNVSSAVATVVATQVLVGGAIIEHSKIAAILMGVVALNGLLYLIPAFKLSDPPGLYEVGDAGNQAVTWKQLKEDAASIFKMRAFWSWFAYGVTATAPWGMYFTAFLFLMDHVIRSTGTQATIADVGSMVIVLALLPLYAKLIKRIGSRTSVFVGMVPYIGGLAGIFWATTWWHILLCYMVLMSGRQIMATAGIALEGALIDDNERQTGTRKTGSFAAIRSLFSAPLAGTQTTIFMWVIAYYGYNQNAEVQSEATQMGIKIAAAGVPIAFTLIGLVALLFLPYSKAIEADLSSYSRERRGQATAFQNSAPLPEASPLEAEQDSPRIRPRS